MSGIVDNSIGEMQIERECGPIKAIDDLAAFLLNPPDWVKITAELCPRSSFVTKYADCHYEDGGVVFRERYDRQSVPKTLVCHDMKNGYLEDKFTGLVNTGNCYTFYRWSHIDIFVYFSHHFITLPPLSWINLAHKNGVQILATLITEWTPGTEICNVIFKDINTTHKFAEQLVDILVLMKLDGWLINIENVIENTSMLLEFVRYLTVTAHRRRPGSVIIWYDSVTTEGKLAWQNELNSENRCYFDVCDGIFLNYSWNVKQLRNSLKNAQHRHLDVFVGVDVFGRNFYGGGKFNSHIAAQKIRESNLSMAIFAQGWTHETLPLEPKDNFLDRFLARDNAFWRSLAPFLYTHPINDVFQTTFHLGSDNQCYHLNRQELQLSRFLHRKELSEEDLVTATLLDNSCNCLHLLNENSRGFCVLKRDRDLRVYIHHLFSCDIQLNGGIVIYTVTKPIKPSNTSETEKPPQIDSTLSLVLIIENANGTKGKVICNSNEKSYKNSTVTVHDVFAIENLDLHKKILTGFESSTVDMKVNCYYLNVHNSRLIEIGGRINEGLALCLCGIGVLKYVL